MANNVSSILLQQEAPGGCAICTTLGVFITRITTDGQPVVLHSLLRPATAREGSLPFASWRTPASVAPGQNRPCSFTFCQTLPRPSSDLLC